jgi:hypothetical protein
MHNPSPEKQKERVNVVYAYRKAKEPRLAFKISIPNTIRERARYLGRGNVSRGIELAVNLAMYHHQDIADWEYQHNRMSFEKSMEIAGVKQKPSVDRRKPIQAHRPAGDALGESET